MKINFKHAYSFYFVFCAIYYSVVAVVCFLLKKELKMVEDRTSEQQYLTADKLQDTHLDKLVEDDYEDILEALQVLRSAKMLYTVNSLTWEEQEQAYDSLDDLRAEIESMERRRLRHPMSF